MGPYAPETYWFEFRGILTNATPTDAYRGAGRPEATYVIERLVDAFARRIGKDPAEVRRMNFHPPFSEATTSICGLNVDSGNYEPALDRALELAEYQQFRKEQQARRDSRDSMQIGIGLSTYIEMCGLAPVEHPGGAAVRGRRMGRGDHPLPSDRQGRGRRRAPRRTVRDTRPPGRRSWPTAWA